jgi:hypothetical protein
MGDNEDDDIEEQWEVAGAMLDQQDTSNWITIFNQQIQGSDFILLERLKDRFRIIMNLVRPFYEFYRMESLESIKAGTKRTKEWMIEILGKRLKERDIQERARELVDAFRGSYTVFYVLFCDNPYPDMDSYYKAQDDDGVTVNLAFMKRAVIRLHNVLSKEMSDSSIIVCFFVAFLNVRKRVQAATQKPVQPPPRDEAEIMADVVMGVVV